MMSRHHQFNLQAKFTKIILLIEIYSVKNMSYTNLLNWTPTLCQFCWLNTFFLSRKWLLNSFRLSLSLSSSSTTSRELLSQFSTCSGWNKWNESGFRPPLCTYRLNWARRTSWGWWDDWDDTVLQTQDSKFEPWRSEAEHATSRSRRLPTILTFTRGWGRNNFVSFKPPRPGTEPRTLAWKAAVLTTTLGPPPCSGWRWLEVGGKCYYAYSNSSMKVFILEPLNRGN